MTNVRSAHVTTRMTCILGMAFAFALFVQVTHAQNYHFSNGWHPGGKKRSSTTIDSSSTADSADILCAFRPDLVDVINKLIQDELTRIQTSCLFTFPRGLRDLLEMPGASTKLGNDKW